MATTADPAAVVSSSEPSPSPESTSASPSPSPTASEFSPSPPSFDDVRPVRTLLPANSTLTVPIRLLNAELTCPVCLSIMRDCTSVSICLHRFCAVCIEKSLRLGKKECPACRVSCPSRRHLRPDPIFDALINIIYPDRDKAEAQQEQMIQQIITSSNVAKFAESALKGAQRQIEKAKEKMTKQQQQQQQREQQQQQEYEEETTAAIQRRLQNNEETIGITLHQHPALATDPVLAQKYNLPQSAFKTLKHINIYLIKKFLNIKLTQQQQQQQQRTTESSTQKTTTSNAETKEPHSAENGTTAMDLSDGFSVVSAASPSPAPAPAPAPAPSSSLPRFTVWFRRSEMNTVAREVLKMKVRGYIRLKAEEQQQQLLQQRIQEQQQQQASQLPQQEGPSPPLTTTASPTVADEQLIVSRKRDASHLSTDDNSSNKSRASNVSPSDFTCLIPVDDADDDHIIGPKIAGHSHITTTMTQFGDFVCLGADTTLGHIAEYMWDREKTLAEVKIRENGSRKRRKKRLHLYYGIEGMNTEIRSLKTVVPAAVYPAPPITVAASTQQQPSAAQAALPQPPSVSVLPPLPVSTYALSSVADSVEFS